MPRLIALLLLIYGASPPAQAQSTNIDSLESVLPNLRDDSLKVQLITQLSFHYIFNDSKTAWDYITKAEQLARQHNLKRGLTEVFRVKGIFYDVTDEGDSAFHYFSRGYEMSKVYNFPDLRVKFLNGLGMNSWTRGQYNLALDYFFKVVEANNALDESKRIPESTPLNNIGLIYQERSLYDKALEYHNRALEIRQRDPKLLSQVATSYNNIGICLKHLQRYDESEVAYRKGIKIASDQNFMLQYYTLLDNLGNTLVLVKRYDEALDLYLQVLNGEKKLALHEKFVMNVHAHAAGIYLHKRQLDKVFFHLEQGFALLEEKPEIKFHASDLYKNASIAWYLKGDTEKGNEYTDVMSDILESNFAKRNAESMAEMEIRYNTAMKENEILKLQTQKEEAELRTVQAELLSKKRERMVYIVLSGCVFALMASVGWYRWKQFEAHATEGQKINNAIFLTEQNERVRIARDMHDSIGQKLSVQKMMLSKISATIDEQLKPELQQASQLLDETVQELRTISHNLIPQELNLGLLKAIQETAERINETEQVNIVVDFHGTIGNADRMPVNHQLSVYRIIQEILNNMLKHARATSISIAIGEKESLLEFSIRDNGKGFHAQDIHASEGIGWKNIIARAKLISAQLKIKSEIDRGTLIKLTVPITS